MEAKRFITLVNRSLRHIGIALLMTAPLLAACSSDDDSTNEESERVAIKVTSGIQTRAAGNTWTAGDAIGIYSLSNGAVADGYANCQYTTAEGGTKGIFSPAADDQTIYFPIDGSTRDILAYYPYSASVSNGVYAIDVSDQSNQETIDFMTSALVSGKHKDDPQVSLLFGHKLTQIQLTMQAGNGVSDDELAGMTIIMTGQTATGTCDVATAGSSVVPTSDATAQSITLKTTSDGKSAEGIILPATSTADMTIEFHLAGVEKPMVWNIADAPESQSFEEGKKYTYTITINRISIDVSATIEDWGVGNGTSGETGNAE